MAAGKVLVDYREQALLGLLLGEAESAPLPVGDVVVHDLSGAPRAILERKGVADLAASIKDGRWREQTSRLRDAAIAANRDDTAPFMSSGIILEGKIGPNGAGGISAASLSNALMAASFRKGIFVLYSADVEDTARIVLWARRCFSRPSSDGAALITNASRRLPGLPRTTRDSVCPSLVATAMLSVVPGVSPSIARSVLDGGSIGSLVRTLLALGGDAERIAAVSDVRHGASMRRVGAAVAARLNDALFGKQIPGQPEKDSKPESAQ
jgi:ERCC4-type nuclease